MSIYIYIFILKSDPFESSRQQWYPLSKNTAIYIIIKVGMSNLQHTCTHTHNFYFLKYIHRFIGRQTLNFFKSSEREFNLYRDKNNCYNFKQFINKLGYIDGNN